MDENTSQVMAENARLREALEMSRIREETLTQRVSDLNSQLKAADHRVSTLFDNSIQQKKLTKELKRELRVYKESLNLTEIRYVQEREKLEYVTADLVTASMKLKDLETKMSDMEQRLKRFNKESISIKVRARRLLNMVELDPIQAEEVSSCILSCFPKDGISNREDVNRLVQYMLIRFSSHEKELHDFYTAEVERAIDFTRNSPDGRFQLRRMESKFTFAQVFFSIHHTRASRISHPWRIS